MNPFSAFLQPRNNAIQVPNTFGDLSALAQNRKELKERAREADQNNAVAQGYLGIQQKNQEHQFAEKDRSEVEGLIAEYQDAVARGEPQGIENAVQKMKRFGLDVGPEAEKLPPGAVRDEKGNLTTRSPFTGLPFGPQNPMNLQQGAVSDDGTPSGVRANDPNDDHELSQKEFEDRLIGDTMADSGIENSRTDGGFQQPGSRPMPDPGDEGRNGNVMDLDGASGGTGAPQAAPQAAQQTQSQSTPRGLPGMLPLIVSRQGKELYRTGGQGRWSPLVQGVFGPLTTQGDANAQAAGKKAQALAEKLVTVDGISPADAIDIAHKMYEKDLDRNAAFSRAQVVARSKASGQPDRTQDTLNDDLDKVRTMWVNSAGYKKMEEQAGQLDDAEAGLMSPDGVSQNNALATLRRIQSGMTLNATEMRDFQSAAGELEALRTRFSRLLGEGQLPDEYRRQVQNVMQQMRQTIQNRMQRGAQEAYDYWMQSRNGRAAPGVIQQKGKALKESLGGKDPNADLDQ